MHQTDQHSIARTRKYSQKRS